VPKPYKLSSTRPLPADAEIVDHEGKPHVRVKDRGRMALYPLTKDRTKYLKPSKRWYFDLRDETGTVQRVKGATDLKATEELAREMERRADRVRVGIIDPAEGHARRPLAEHLKDYAAVLTAKGSGGKHVRDTLARCTALFQGAGIVFWKDVDPGKAADWLNARRRDDRPIVLPDDENFRPSTAAKLLGISLTALGNAIRRHRLAATGNGKARRLPRQTVLALADRAARGAGAATVNHYVIAVRGFFRWLVKAKRMGSNPLESLSLAKATVDVRRTRRELTADELRQLFQAARTSDRVFRGLTGTDRYMLYLTAAGTGFRANALANLTPADFDLDAATVTLAARFNKSKRLKVQPLPADVADELRGFLTGKPSNSPVWGGTWAKECRGAEMLRIDLDAAGIPYTVQGPDGPEYADFHALRHSYLTLGGRSGIDLRTLQELAGHSTPELTARYMHLRLRDTAGAVGKLPRLVPTASGERPDQAIVPVLRTGTNGTEPTTGRALHPTKSDDDVRLGVVPGVVTGRAEGHPTASIGTLRVVGAVGDEVADTPEKQGAGADLRRPASDSNNAPRRTRTYNPLIKSQWERFVRNPRKTLVSTALSTKT
jgi:integrase/recombinase XerC